MKNEMMFREFRKGLEEHYGKKCADALWQQARQEYRRLIRVYPGLKGDGKNMWTAAAIYLAVKSHDPENALTVLCGGGQRAGVKLRGTVHKITSIRGLPELLWRHMPSVMKYASSEKKGYARKIVGDTPELVGVDIVACPIYEAAKEMDMPEAARMICAMDKEYMSGFRRIDYTRTMSLAEGDPCCDYRMRYDADKQ